MVMIRPNSQHEKSIKSVLDDIKKLSSMSQLSPDQYAPEGKLAEEVAKNVKIKATQLRKIFHYVKNLRRSFQKTGFRRSEIALMMPMLAYSAGRDLIPEDFYELMVLCFDKKCKTGEDFESAASFLEAIMAYHKFHHPKD